MNTRNFANRLVILTVFGLLAACGGGSSAPVVPPPPAAALATITAQPADQSVVAGTPATFNVVATGATGYQWQRSADGGATFTNANGATGASHTTALTTLADSGAKYRVLAINAAGSTTSAAATLTVNAIVPRFAYVANSGESTVSIYTVNATTGQLRYNGYVAAGSYPSSVTLHPSGKFAYVANFYSNDVSAYTINTTTGALTSIGATVAAGRSPQSVTVDPSGKFAYVANQTSGTVSAYTIDGGTGALTPAGTVAAGTAAQSITVDPSGKFAYVANGGGTTVSAYTIDAMTGALSSISAVPAGFTPYSVTFAPSGKFAYVANHGGTVSAYAFNATTGALTLVGTVTAGSLPSSVTVDPSGKFAYVANWGTGDVSAYNIDASTGALVQIPCGGGAGCNGANYKAEYGLYSVLVDPSGKFVYVTGDRYVSAYSINAGTGALTSLGPVRNRTNSKSIAMTKGTTAVVYTPKAAYVANSGDASVSQYTIGTSGALTPMATPTVAAGSSPRSVTVDLLGRFAYVANFSSDNVSAYSIDPVTRALSPVIGSPFAAGTSPTAVTIDSSGRFLYVSNYGWPGSGTVSAYAIDATSGALTTIAGSPFAAGAGSSSIDADPTGRYVYVANLLNDTFSAFSINSTSGILSRLDADPVTAGIQDLSVTNARPVSIAADPTGRFVYVATACGTSWVFEINVYGLLARVDSAPGGLCGAAGNTPDSLALDPAGRYLYMDAVDPVTGVNQITAQTIDASAGTLTAVTGSPFSAVSGTRSVTVDISGKYAYATGNASLFQFTIDANGALTPMTTATVAAGASPNSVTTTGTIQ